MIDNSTISALYKTVHKSNDATAFSNNSQRRLIQTKTGNNPRWLHQVYTSSIGGVSHVWIEHSSDGGSSWVLGNSGKPLDGGAGGKNPSIAYSYNSINNCNYIGTVWQQQDGSTYQIMGKMFSQFTTSNSVPGYESEVRRIYPINPGENTESYSVNANPNLMLVGNGWPTYFITFEKKSASVGWQPGINWVIGNIEDIGHGYCGPFGYVESSTKAQGIIIGNASTTNVQISLYPNPGYYVWLNLIRQQGSPGAIYNHDIFLYKDMGGHWIYDQIDDGMISYPVNVNSNPSIVSLPNYYYSACWKEYADMVFYYSGNQIRYYYGNYIESCSINRGGGTSNSGFAVWSEHPQSSWYNRSIRFDNGIPVSSSFRTLSTSGKYVQVGNGAHTDHSYMYVSSFYPFTSPYSFGTSGTLSPLSKENPELVEGRGFEIDKGDATFSYRFGDLNVDGNNIAFVDAPDELNYGEVETLNNVLITEPFQVSNNSRIVFSEMSGFADSLGAARKLGKDGFINLKLELIDDAAGEVIALIRKENLNSSNVHSVITPAYLLNANGLGGKTVRIKISLETNLIEQSFPQLVAGDPSNIPDAVKIRLNTPRSNLMLTKSLSGENSALAKTSLTGLELSGLDIPTTYDLAQNYPNPFNPSTTIKYQIPEEGLVTLKIYDILGKEIKILVNEQKATGRYEVRFDASDLATGVYIYRVDVNDFVSVKKMLLIK